MKTPVNRVCHSNHTSTSYPQPMFARLTWPLAITLFAGTCLTACGSDSSDSSKSSIPVDTATFGALQSNLYYPFASGLLYRYDTDGSEGIEAASSGDDMEEDDRDTVIEVHYTTQQREVDNINAVAVIEKVFEDDELTEEVTKWVAMDVDGSVWLLEQTAVSYEDGEIDAQNTWTAGVDGAQRGLLMPASVSIGDSFLIENRSENERTSGVVMSTTDTVSLEDLGDYLDVLHIEMTIADENETSVEHHYYAPAMGLVRYTDEDDVIYDLDSITSILMQDIDVAADTMPPADNSYGEFDDLNFTVAYDSDESSISITASVELDDAFEELKIWGPEGQLQTRFKAEELEDLGFSELILESDEGQLEELLEEITEGTYTFLAETTDDEMVYGQAELSFELLDPPTLNACETDIDIDNATLVWTSTGNADAFEVEIASEEDGTEFELLLNVDADTDRVTVPASLLTSGAAYSVEIGAVNEEGNITSTECEFSIN